MSPSGKVHYKWWKKFLWLALIIGAAFAWLSVPLGLGVVFGYLLGRYIDPDLDLVQTSSSEYRAMRELKIFGALLVAYWLPYSYVIPHRSPLSHFPILGTLGRFVYVFWWLVPLYIFAGVEFNNIMLFFLIGIFNGLNLSDTIHWVLDVVTT